MPPKGVKLCIKAGVQVPQETSCHPDHLPLGRSINQTRPQLQTRLPSLLLSATDREEAIMQNTRFNKSDCNGGSSAQLGGVLAY